MRLLLLVTASVFAMFSSAQVVRQPLSVSYAALGAYSKNFSDLFSAVSNQASLASLKTSAFAAFGERRFMLADLSAYTAIAALPVQGGAFEIQADYFGSASFSETQIGFGYGRKISSKVDAGVKFNYETVRVSGYRTVTSVNFEGGFIFHVSDKLHTGIHIYNPTSSKLGKTGSEKLASVYVVGVGYEVSETLFISGEMVKHEDQPASVNAGLQYNLAKSVFVRAGTSANNNSYVSIGLNLDFGRIDLNTAYHSQLGFTPGILLLFNLKKQAEE